MSDITIRLKGLGGGKSGDLTIDSGLNTMTLYEKVFEKIGGTDTGRNIKDLRLATPQIYRAKPVIGDDMDYIHAGYEPLKVGETPKPIEIGNDYDDDEQISDYLKGGEVVHYYFKMENQDPGLRALLAREDLRPARPPARERAASKRNKRRKSKKRKSKKRKSKKRKSKKRKSR